MMQQNQGKIIIYQAEDGLSALEVHLAEETVWLTQAQMTELTAKFMIRIITISMS